MSDIFKEIEEDLQRDRLKQLWSKYGVAVIAAAIAAVVATGGWEAWKAYRDSRNLAFGKRYAEAAALTQSQPKEAIRMFAKLAEDAGGSYAALARLQEAAIMAKSGDQKGAVALYNQVADSGASAAYRDLATLLAVEHDADKGDAGVLIKRLEPLTEAGNPWRYVAIELSAVLASRMGDTAHARTLYGQLADDAGAPASLRARAAEMLAALKG